MSSDTQPPETQPAEERRCAAFGFRRVATGRKPGRGHGDDLERSLATHALPPRVTPPGLDIQRAGHTWRYACAPTQGKTAPG